MGFTSAFFSAGHPARPGRWRAAGLLALALAGCRQEAEKVAPADTDYYPLSVGDYRIYDVVDTVWTRNVKSYDRFQFRERVAEAYTDAAGRPSFRIIRSRRADAARPWLDDSVLVLSPGADNVLLTRNNRRTVELIFPVRENYSWNLNAFNSLDPVTAQNRRYLAVGQPFTAVAGGRTYTYALTATAFDESIEKQCFPRWQYQVYAKGQGPVYRQLRSFSLDNAGTCSPIAVYVARGRSRTEVLVEQGR